MDYANLRSWYLANLRKNITGKKHARSLTPIAQIAADKLAVEELISNSAKAQARQTLSLTRLPSLTAALAICLLTSVVAWAALSAANLLGGPTGQPLWGVVPLLLAPIMLYAYARHRIMRLTTAMEMTQLEGSTEREAIPKEVLLRLEKQIRRAQTAYHQSVERENAIADYALPFFFALNTDGLIIAASPRAVEFCGFDDTELIGQRFSKLCADVDVPRTESFFAAMTSATDAVPFDCMWRRKNAKLIDVRLSAEYSPTQKAFFCVARDITPEKQIERLRKEFVAMVGHDLKSPLTSVMCNLDLIRYSDPNLSEQSRDLIHSVQTNVDRLLEMINDLLDLSKMEAGKLPMLREKIQVREIFEAAHKSVSGALAPRRISLSVEDTELVVLADKKRMIQVIVNLLSNALKYSPDGGTIRLTASTNGQSVTAKISDEGPGIAPEYRQLIFERYRQIEPARQAATGGSGLGLAICKQIVEAHEGHIGVDSELGHGSTFWFSLPTQ